MKTVTSQRAALIAAMALASGNARAADWDWVVAPYLWLSSISVDLNEDNPPPGNESDYPDVLEDLDGTFQAHVEGQGDSFGLFGDVLYLGLSDGNERDLFATESELDAIVLDAGLVWNVEAQRYEGMDLFAGVRYIDLDFSAAIDPVNPALATWLARVKRSYTDLLVGGRYSAVLSDRWKLIARVDGSLGDSDGIFNAALMAAWATGKRGSWSFGYRYMHGELGEDGREIDVTLHGPVVSYAFGFR